MKDIERVRRGQEQTVTEEINRDQLKAWLSGREGHGEGLVRDDARIKPALVSSFLTDGVETQADQQVTTIVLCSLTRLSKLPHPPGIPKYNVHARTVLPAAQQYQHTQTHRALLAVQQHQHTHTDGTASSAAAPAHTQAVLPAAQQHRHTHRILPVAQQHRTHTVQIIAQQHQHTHIALQLHSKTSTQTYRRYCQQHSDTSTHTEYTEHCQLHSNTSTHKHRRYCQLHSNTSTHTRHCQQ
ncbi:hypothetical protein PoB_006261200 [Plakobranchus ocellatus]|uniref:Uncharacterized protein n=1 Tax=Plakobranchus ocellatus TaxID=259542 RepID=A0AAV4CW23_9GAST|nr:hypothetical protein PoB_006261200 [Plakobranchus ocellatus]